MRLVIQRVTHASVTIEGALKSKIRKGLLILVGIEDADTDTDVNWLAQKVVNLRIFDDENGVMNRSRTTPRFPRHREMRAFVSCMA